MVATTRSTRNPAAPARRPVRHPAATPSLDGRQRRPGGSPASSRRCTGATTGPIGSTAADLPVTRRALEVLQHLSASGPLTVGEQAEHLGLRRNSVSELLQRLEAKGLVARIRDERDERRVLVWLTDAGRDVVSRVGQVLAPDLIAQVMATLSPEERAIVVRGFELLAAADPSKPTAAARRPPNTIERNPDDTCRDLRILRHAAGRRRGPRPRPTRRSPTAATAPPRASSRRPRNAWRGSLSGR